MIEHVTKINRAWASLSHDGGGDNPYTVGMVYTPLGIVAVYSQRDPRDGSGFTMLSFVCEGYNYQRNIGTYHTDRYLVTLADRFAREVVEKSY